MNNLGWRQASKKIAFQKLYYFTKSKNKITR